MSKNDKVNENKSGKNKVVWWIVSLSLVAIGLLLTAQFVFTGTNSNTFYENTRINGVDVSGLTKDEASNIIATRLLASRDEISIELSYKDKVWKYTGKDFEVHDEISPMVDEVFNYGRSGNFFERRAMLKKIKQGEINTDVSYKTVLGGIDQKIDQIASEIEKQPVEPEVIFEPLNKKMFTLKPGEKGIAVDREKLYADIDKAFTVSKAVKVEIPVVEIDFEKVAEELIKNTQKRSEFSTSYATSTKARKHNVNLALSKFNGMVVKPDEEISFNQVTGSRSEENGYKKANVILNGVYVEGSGGGVCQASTTLYNALILSDLEILESNHHSLPASYVPLAFDAMVSEGYSDLRFKNNTGFNIYIKTYGNDTDVFVEIYGKPFDEGETVRRKAEFIRVIPHSGDKIVEDANGDYADKVTYKGEYFRLKYPREGYESNGYLQYLKNGEVVSEKLLRHDIYEPQDGIIIEGKEELGEGMTLPENNVEFIPPQNNSNVNKDNVAEKIKKVNPSKYNP